MGVSHWEKLAVLFHPLTVTAEVEFVDRDQRLFLRVVVVMPVRKSTPTQRLASAAENGNWQSAA